MTELAYNQFNKIVQINVGGTVFKTRANTLLTKVSRNRQHLLERLYETNVALYETNQGFTLFIDREPSYFRYILNFLRNLKFNLELEQSMDDDVIEAKVGQFLQPIASEELKLALYDEFKYFEIYPKRTQY